MRAADLRRIGAILYGDRWQTDLARALGVADRTVRRWAAGTHPIPEGLKADLLKLLAQRSAEVGRALAGLR